MSSRHYTWHPRRVYTSHSKVMSARLGRTPTYEKILYVSFVMAFTEYMQKLDFCQRQSSLPPKIKKVMHIVPVSLDVIKQGDLDLCCFPEVDGYRHLLPALIISLNGRRPNQSEIRQLLAVATFLDGSFYELMCHHGWSKSKSMINDENLSIVCLLAKKCIVIWIPEE